MFDHIQLPEDLKPTDPRFGVGPSLVPVEFLERLAKTGSVYLGLRIDKKLSKTLSLKCNKELEITLSCLKIMKL